MSVITEQPVDWAARIKALITDQGMTKSELARQLRISPATVSLWESGAHEPQHMNAKRIEKLEEKLRMDGGGGDLPADSNAFAQQLIQVREEHGLTQDDLAKALDVPKYSVIRWERGERLPRAGTVKKLERFLKRSNGPAVKQTNGGTTRTHDMGINDLMAQLRDNLAGLCFADVGQVDYDLVMTLTEDLARLRELKDWASTPWREIEIEG